MLSFEIQDRFGGYKVILIFDDNRGIGSILIKEEEVEIITKSIKQLIEDINGYRKENL